MNRVKTAKKQNQILQANVSEVKNLIEQELVVRRESPERTASLALLAEKSAEIEKLRKELAQYGSCDPVQVEAKRRAITLAHEAAVRWTENYLMMTPIVKRTGVDWCVVQAYLGIEDTDEYESIN